MRTKGHLIALFAMVARARTRIHSHYKRNVYLFNEQNGGARSLSFALFFIVVSHFIIPYALLSAELRVFLQLVRRNGQTVEHA